MVAGGGGDADNVTTLNVELLQQYPVSMSYYTPQLKSVIILAKVCGMSEAHWLAI